VLPAAISRFLEGLPQAKVRVVTATNPELLSRLSIGELDFVLGGMGDPAQMLGLTFEQLYSEPLIFIAKPSHPIFSRGADNNLESALGYRLILPFEGTHIRRSADAFLARNGVSRPLHTIEALSMQFTSTMLLTTEAIWFGPWGAMELDILAKRFKLLRIDTEDTLGPVGLTLRTQKEMSAPLLKLIADTRAAAAERRRDAWREWLYGADPRRSSPAPVKVVA
ncbi:MAG: LysR substrate-binding domain-containing protein, partial [Gammaproteobacteria bacterium]